MFGEGLGLGGNEDEGVPTGFIIAREAALGLVASG